MSHFFSENPVPAKTGNWAEDNQSGRNFAERFLKHGVSNPTLLNHVVQGMAKVGPYGGLEVGFFHRISEALQERES